MDDLDHHLLSTYLRLRPTLTPAQIAARLARRQTPTLTRPPRAWCLAVRASDTRITDATAILIPHRPGHARHQVVLDAKLLEALCTAVDLIPGTVWTDLAAALGVHPESLRYAMNKGHLRVLHYKGLGGKRGKPVPTILNSTTLDPSAARFHEPADPLWGHMWRHAATRIPKDLAQPVTRTPAFANYQGQPRFRGYRWLCPVCEKKVRTLFYPLPPYRLQTLVGDAGGPCGLPASVGHVPHPTPHSGLSTQDSMPSFACHTCHRIRYYSSLTKDGWNHFITHITAGLLYGHEVPRAHFAPPTRKRPYRPHLLRPPSPRRQQVRDLLLEGKTYAEIAQTLRVGYATVHVHVKRLYKQYDVHSRAQLRTRLHLNASPTKDAAPLTQVESRVASTRSKNPPRA